MHREPKKPKNAENPSSENPEIDSPEPALNLPFEDQAKHYLKDNANSLIAIVVIIAVGISVIQGLKISKAAEINALQADYLSAEQEDSLEVFIENNSDTLLAGFAAIKQANAAFESEDYESALRLFLKAEKSLAGNPLKSRASIGVAYSMLEIDSEKGIEKLQALLDDESNLDSVIAEAAYALASIASAEGDTEKAKNLAELVQSLENPGSWSFRINQFL